MHERTFPQSQEPVDAQSARALAGLDYEDRAGLGYRRTEREFGTTNEHDPSGIVELGESRADLVAAYIASVGFIAALGSAVYKPIILIAVAFLCSLIGVGAGGRAAGIGKLGMVTLGIFGIIGLLFALVAERPLY